MTRYAIALGSNVGDRLGYLVAAAGALSERLGRVSASSLYETLPVGGPKQDPFLNAVVVVESDLDAGQVLEICQEIEHTRGRERQQRWGPRTLDLDIVTSDGP
ncbi:MAG: 2-amino-4-hydroxy-6-hydroxymethyldihydropteridine diphosphokinase, partial [Actinomycetota bacterium]